MKYLKEIWSRWKILAEKIGGFQTSLLFSILYFLMIVPVGILANIFGDYLREKSFPRWTDYMKSETKINDLRKQY